MREAAGAHDAPLVEARHRLQGPAQVGRGNVGVACEVDGADAVDAERVAVAHRREGDQVVTRPHHGEGERGSGGFPAGPGDAVHDHLVDVGEGRPRRRGPERVERVDLALRPRGRVPLDQALDGDLRSGAPPVSVGDRHDDAALAHEEGRGVLVRVRVLVGLSGAATGERDGTAPLRDRGDRADDIVFASPQNGLVHRTAPTNPPLDCAARRSAHNVV
jgi:hypothetical protein